MTCRLAYCSAITDKHKSITDKDITKLFSLKYAALYFPFNYPNASDEAKKNINEQTFAGFIRSLHDYTINTIKLGEKNFISSLQPCDKKFMYPQTKMLKKLYSKILLESLNKKTSYYVIGVKYSAGDVQPCITGSYTQKDGSICCTVQRELREEIGLDVDINNLDHPTIYTGAIQSYKSSMGTMYGFAIHISKTISFTPSSSKVDYREGTDNRFKKVMVCIYGSVDELLDKCNNIVARKKSIDTSEIVGLTFINIMDAINIHKNVIK